MQDDVQAKYGTSKIVALIMGTWVPILYYNKDLFDAAGACAGAVVASAPVAGAAGAVVGC
jgi:ABC-type glycerol-3-phosphate transport system substrate-binding protein